MVHALILLGCAVVIYLACEWFVNAVEWCGPQLRIGPLAVGTILAAVGTALPESVVTLVAVTFGGVRDGADIGVGAALGGPLVVGTIAYATVGAALIGRRRSARASATMPECRPPGPPWTGTVPKGGVPGAVDAAPVVRDQTWFLMIFVVKVGLGLVAFPSKPWLALAFFAAYGAYAWRELRGGGPSSAEGLEPLRLQPRRAVPSWPAVVAQTMLTLGLIFAASRVFVGQLEWAGPALGLPPVVVALLLSPIATELPETMNALIWVRRGKTQLALANISGAMMIQATVPSGLGLLFTSWRFDTPLLLAGIATTAAVLYLLALLRARRLTLCRLTAAAAFYGAFAVAMVPALAG